MLLRYIPLQNLLLKWIPRQKFVCEHLKGKHSNLKHALEKHYTDKDDLKEAHLKHISHVVKKLNKEFGYSTLDEVYLYRKGEKVIFER